MAGAGEQRIPDPHRIEAESLRPEREVEQRAGVRPALHDPLPGRQKISDLWRHHPFLQALFRGAAAVREPMLLAGDEFEERRAAVFGLAAGAQDRVADL